MEPKKRHKRFLEFVRPFVRLFFKLRYGFEFKPVFDLPKQFFVLSNHVTQVDPILLSVSFRDPIYYMASETIFRKAFLTKLLKFFFNPIQKRKNETDVVAVRNIISVAKQGACVGIFLTGNTTYSGEEEYIESPIVRLVRMVGLPLVLHNFKGGYGVAPRWGYKLRKGRFYNEINRVISKEEYDKMSDDELEKIIKDGLNVKADDLELEYKSNRSAEYLERALFVCPECHSIHTMSSKGNNFKCTKCGYEVTYQSNLSFSLVNGKQCFKNVKEWYDFEKEYIRNFDFSIYKNEPIVENSGLKIVDLLKENKKQKNCYLKLYYDFIDINGWIIKIDNISSLSSQGKHSLLIKAKDTYIEIKGNPRFSTLIYVFIFYSIKNRKAGNINGFLGI